VHLLLKCDLLPKQKVDKVADWSSNPNTLASAIDEKLEGTKRLLGRNVMQAIYKLGLKFLLTPVSAKTSEGIISFNTPWSASYLKETNTPSEGLACLTFLVAIWNIPCCC
jgi:hypothetical protein